MTQAPFFNLFNDLREWDHTDHHHRYFDNESFDTKFKAFRNLGAEWQGWMQIARERYATIE